MRDRIATALREAKSTGDETRLCTLRLICAALQDREADLREQDQDAVLPEAEVGEILGKMVRQRESQIGAYEESGRLELAERERREAEIIAEFLPPRMDDEAVRAAVREAIATTKAHGLKDIHAVLGELKSRYAGRMDFCKAGAQARAALR
ncbi:MAG: GatB/YqeY domain-containing protein [Pseudomonadota bacterium]